jgi:predicted ATPase
MQMVTNASLRGPKYACSGLVGGASGQVRTTLALEADVLALIPALVEKSLLLAEPGDEVTRFGMLETVRQYALEKLTAAGEERSSRDCHLSWVVALSRRAEPGLAGPQQRVWVRICEAELDNLRAALTWAHRTGQHEAGLRVAGVHRLWQALGDLSAGRSWLERFLDDPGDATASCEPTHSTCWATWP